MKTNYVQVIQAWDISKFSNFLTFNLEHQKRICRLAYRVYKENDKKKEDG